MSSLGSQFSPRKIYDPHVKSEWREVMLTGSQLNRREVMTRTPKSERCRAVSTDVHSKIATRFLQMLNVRNWVAAEVMTDVSTQR